MEGPARKPPHQGAPVEARPHPLGAQDDVEDLEELGALGDEPEIDAEIDGEVYHLLVPCGADAGPQSLPQAPVGEE